MLHDIRPPRHRRLVMLAQASSPLGYGCSACHWRFDPEDISHVCEPATILTAQVRFGSHDCEQFPVHIGEVLGRSTKGSAA